MKEHIKPRSWEERERERQRADLFSVHNRSRVQIDVDSIPVLTNFKTIYLHIQINVRQFIDLWTALLGKWGGGVSSRDYETFGLA